jgi:hypothetical protein
MVAVSFSKVGLVVAATVLMCGCSANGGLDLSTASIAPQQSAAKADPVCASLASQISSLKADGTIDKLEQAADGKTSKVSIKRTALQKQAELNKAYEQYQARCGQTPPSQTAAAQSPSDQTASANK